MLHVENGDTVKSGLIYSPERVIVETSHLIVTSYSVSPEASGLACIKTVFVTFREIPPKDSPCLIAETLIIPGLSRRT